MLYPWSPSNVNIFNLTYPLCISLISFSSTPFASKWIDTHNIQYLLSQNTLRLFFESLPQYTAWPALFPVPIFCLSRLIPFPSSFRHTPRIHPSPPHTSLMSSIVIKVFFMLTHQYTFYSNLSFQLCTCPREIKQHYLMCSESMRGLERPLSMVVRGKINAVCEDHLPLLMPPLSTSWLILSTFRLHMYYSFQCLLCVLCGLANVTEIKGL